MDDLRMRLEEARNAGVDCAPIIQEMLNAGYRLSAVAGHTYVIGSTIVIPSVTELEDAPRTHTG